MSSLILPASLLWAAMTAGVAFPTPKVLEELDGLHLKESMRSLHRVRKVRRQQKPKRNKGLSQCSCEGRVVLGRKTNHEEAIIPPDTDRYHITVLSLGRGRPKMIEHAVLSGWNGVESFVKNRSRKFGDVPEDTLDILRKAANASDYQDNEINLVDPRGYTEYMYCIEGPIQEEAA